MHFLLLFIFIRVTFKNVCSVVVYIDLEMIMFYYFIQHLYFMKLVQLSIYNCVFFYSL